MNDVHVIGTAMTPFGKLTDWTVKDMTARVVRSVLAEAVCDIGSVGAAYFANSTQGALEGQYMIRGQIALRPLGITGIPVINVENACASGATAFNLAWQSIRSGVADIALAVGVEKMVVPDRAKSMQVFEGAVDVARKAEVLDALMQLSDGLDIPQDAIADAGVRSAFMDVYAAMARAHMRHFGTTARHLAIVSAKNHRQSVHNDKAQFRTAFTVEEVLAARRISWPLTLPMCSPISDGAAAVLLASDKAVKRLRASQPLRVRASVIATGSDRAPQDYQRYVTRIAAASAYEQAGIGPEDISVAEVHDATAFGEIQQSEALGFCEIGMGGPLAESGATAIGGRIPINPSGGLESKGHPIGATGLGQIHELALQLRNRAAARQVEGARLALAENGGGLYGYEEAVGSVIILEGGA